MHIVHTYEYMSRHEIRWIGASRGAGGEERWTRRGIAEEDGTRTHNTIEYRKEEEYELNVYEA